MDMDITIVGITDKTFELDAAVITEVNPVTAEESPIVIEGPITKMAGVSSSSSFCGGISTCMFSSMIGSRTRGLTEKIFSSRKSTRPDELSSNIEGVQGVKSFTHTN